jgi:formamidopyrimidine-DNA glycosylase
VGQKIIKLTRRSKYLLVHLSNEYVVSIHLGMTGRITLQNLDYICKKHDHIVIESNDFKLVYNDIRRFGYWFIIQENELAEHPMIKILGPEPLEQEFSSTYLANKLANLKTNIKAALMNSKIVVGVGNIYADEALWRSKIHPESRTETMKVSRIKDLIESAKEVMSEALKVGGTSFDDLYINVNGESGYFERSLSAYGQEGEGCPRCGREIRRITFANRSSHFCPKCQPTPRARRNR